MSRKITGVILLLLLGAAAIVGVRLLLPYFQERKQKTTSDARNIKGKITVALDNWIGYFPLRSPEMRTAMSRAGWQMEIMDDNADYAGRMEKLKKGDIDFAVATVDSFILNAHAVDYPGTIVMVIDESKGGDCILARDSVAKSLMDLKGKRGLKVAFTPNSPSHHLLKAAKDHFDVPELLPGGSNRIETNGSEEALKKLLAGGADLAVLWEPDVSRALAAPGVVKLLGTEDTERLIVDILVVNRKFSAQKPEVVKLLLTTYFRVLKTYRDSPDLLKEHIEKETGVQKDAVDPMLKGVAWVNFSDNCENWFDISGPGGRSTRGLVDTIYSTASILTNTGDFKTTPLPDNDPYRLINSSFLQDMFATGMTSGFKTSGTTPVKTPVSSLEARFSPLDDAGWDKLKQVGTLKVAPIVFQSSSTDLDLLAKEVVDRAVERLRHYPNFRLVIKGHTGTRGDGEENRRLSLDRADAVAKYLEITYNVDPNRMRAMGFGGAKPLPRKQGESKRAYEYRLPRVELVLVREDI